MESTLLPQLGQLGLLTWTAKELYNVSQNQSALEERVRHLEEEN